MQRGDPLSDAAAAYRLVGIYRAPTRGAPTDCPGVYRLPMRAGGTGTHKGCPYGSWASEDQAEGGQGRHKAGTYGDLMGLAGFGLARHLRSGTCHQFRHPVDEALGGALRGRSPRTREGRIGPTAQLQ